jgi:hypothetical protein
MVKQIWPVGVRKSLLDEGNVFRDFGKRRVGWRRVARFVMPAAALIDHGCGFFAGRGFRTAVGAVTVPGLRRGPTANRTDFCLLSGKGLRSVMATVLPLAGRAVKKSRGLGDSGKSRRET